MKNINLIPIFIFIFTFAIYINGISPAVFGGDSGDVLTASVTRGIAHPSGYPLQTMFGILFLKLPVSATPAWKVGLVSSLFSSLTLVATYLTVRQLTKRRSLAFLTSLSLAFTYSFWLYAEVVEVFALYSFFISILIYLTIKYSLNKENKILYLLALFAGLSLTNNQSIIILFPFILISVLLTNWKIILNLKTILKGLLFFLIGLTPYLYIPFAAQRYPAMNWGFAVNLENFWYLVSRQYYGWGEGLNTVKVNYTVDNIILRMGTYFNYWKSYINPLAPILILLGIFEIIKEKRIKIFIFLFFSLLFFGPLFVIFAGSDFKSYLGLATIERFIISNLLVSFILLPFGVIFLENLILNLPLLKKPTKHFLKSTIIPIAFLIPIISFSVNHKRTNLSKVYIGDQLAINVLSNLPKDSVLMLRNDSLAFNTIYYQQAYNFRKDVSIPGMHNGFEVNLRAIGKTNKEISNHIIKNKGGIDKNIFDKSITALLNERKNVYIDGIYTINEKDDRNKIVTIPFGLLYKFEFYKNLPYPKEEYLDIVDRITYSYQTEMFAENEEVLLYSLIFADIKKLYSADFYRISEFIYKQYRDKSAAGYLIKSSQLDSFSQFNNAKQN